MCERAFSRVRLEPFGSGKIYPHEETMSGPKEDRLKLMRAAAMNFSPIFGLYPDDKSEVQKALDDAVGRNPPLEASDHLGVVSRLWPVTDQHVLSAITGLMGPKPIFIADGHHRYETGMKYLQERRDAGDVPNDDAPANFILMNLVSMSDPGLIILPTHRLVSGLPGISADRLRTILTPNSISNRSERAAMAVAKPGTEFRSMEIKIFLASARSPTGNGKSPACATAR